MAHPTDIAEKLQNALYSLSDYHKALLQQETLKSQDPQQLEDISALLRNRGDAICSFIHTGILPAELSSDIELKNCLEYLKQTNIPYSALMNTMICYWTKLMFQDYPFSISPSHIEDLFNNSLEAIELEKQSKELDEESSQ